MEIKSNEVSPLEVSLHLWMDKWVIDGFHPQMLKITAGPNIPLTKLTGWWYILNPCTPTGYTGCLKVFSSLKVSMDFYPTLPDFQLQFGKSCTLPFVKPNKFGLFGLLGLEEEDILLTDFIYGGKVLHKAVMIRLDYGMRRSQFSSDVMGGLSFVTQFDASRCDSIHSGHLEQLAITCPNLDHLNLLGNDYCLENLQGLHVISACFKKLQGLNLVSIPVDKHQVVELWKILADMRLTYLAIELCAMTPQTEHEQEIISLFQECIYLKAIEVRRTRLGKLKHDLSVLSCFPSLVHCIVGDIPNSIEVVINSCSKLKYFVYSSYFLQLLSIQNKNVEQLSIKTVNSNYVIIPDSSYSQYQLMVDWFMLLCMQVVCLMLVLLL